jgi:hypothetical protein
MLLLLVIMQVRGGVLRRDEALDRKELGGLVWKSSLSGGGNRG